MDARSTMACRREMDGLKSFISLQYKSYWKEKSRNLQPNHIDFAEQLFILHKNKKDPLV